MKKNIPGWLPEENQKVLDYLIKKYDIKSVIEIGSFIGKSTVFFAERCGKVIAVEPFDAINSCNYLNGEMKALASNQRAEFNRNVSGFKNIEVYDMTSQEASKKDIFADLIYIDGAHDYENVKLDIGLWLPRAKKIICGDDYSEWWPGVRGAVDELLPLADKNNRVWFFIK